MRSISKFDAARHSELVKDETIAFDFTSDAYGFLSIAMTLNAITARLVSEIKHDLVKYRRYDPRARRFNIMVAQTKRIEAEAYSGLCHQRGGGDKNTPYVSTEYGVHITPTQLKGFGWEFKSLGKSESCDFINAVEELVHTELNSDPRRLWRRIKTNGTSGRASSFTIGFVFGPVGRWTGVRGQAPSPGWASRNKHPDETLTAFQARGAKAARDAATV